MGLFEHLSPLYLLHREDTKEHSSRVEMSTIVAEVGDSAGGNSVAACVDPVDHFLLIAKVVCGASWSDGGMTNNCL